MFPKHMNRAHTESRETEKKKVKRARRSKCVYVGENFYFLQLSAFTIIANGRTKRIVYNVIVTKIGFRAARIQPSRAIHH